MIPILLKMADDELMASWLQEMALINKSTFHSFAADYLQWNTSEKPLRFPQMLEYSCKRFERMSFFPNPFDAICKHTDLIAMSVAISRRGMAYCVEQVLHEKKPSRLVYKGYKVCPKCKAEDKQFFGRTIIHVPHQMAGVNVCWKHGCPLTADGTHVIRKYRAIERRVALYALALYEKPIDGYLEQTRIAIQHYLNIQQIALKDLLAEAVYKGYLGPKGLSASYQQFYSRRIRPLEYTIRLLAFIYPDIEQYRSIAEPCAYHPMDTAKVQLLDSEHNIGKYRCLSCNRVFYSHEYAVSENHSCPYCKNTLKKHST